MSEVLVLYHSPGGTIAELAAVIARGVESVEGMNARVRTVPTIRDGVLDDSDPVSGPPFASHDDLTECEGLILGCPTHFGNMTASMKHFIDSTSPLWLAGKLAGKPAAVFSGSTSMHGGQESTLLTMMLPLLHHGMLITGLPYTETRLLTTDSGGSPYGATRLTDDHERINLTDDERQLALALGSRVANIAAKLSA